MKLGDKNWISDTIGLNEKKAQRKANQIDFVQIDDKKGMSPSIGCT